MSRIPRYIRLQAAAREIGDVIERYNEGTRYDYAIDYGEFSGPASARAMERDMFRTAARWHVSFEAAYMDLMFQYEDERPERWPGEHDGDDPPRPFSPRGFAA